MLYNISRTTGLIQYYSWPEPKYELWPEVKEWCRVNIGYYPLIIDEDIIYLQFQEHSDYILFRLCHSINFIPQVD